MMGGVGDDRYLLHVQRYNNGRWQSYVSIRFDAFRYDFVFIIFCHSTSFASSSSSWVRKSRQRASTMLDSWPFPAPLSATRLAIIPLVSFHERSGYINFAPLTCAPRIGKSMGTMGWCMSFETCESKRATHSSPRPRFGIFGAVVLLISYFIFFFCFKV